MSNLLTEVFFAPEEAEKLRVVENISLARLRELAEAERDGQNQYQPIPELRNVQIGNRGHVRKARALQVV